MSEVTVSGKVRWAILLFQFIAITLFVFALAGQIRAGDKLTGSASLANFETPMGGRKFIGLPDVDTFSIQNIGVSNAAQITITLSLSNGLPVTTFGDSIPSDSFRVYTSEADLASIDANQEVYGVNFELSESGNDAYSAPRLDFSTAKNRQLIGGPWRSLMLPSSSLFMIKLARLYTRRPSQFRRAVQPNSI